MTEHRGCRLAGRHVCPDPLGRDVETLSDVVFRMAEDITRIKKVCTQDHPPKMGSPTPDWPAGTETRHSDGTRCLLLNDGDYAVLRPAQTTGDTQ